MLNEVEIDGVRTNRFARTIGNGKDLARQRRTLAQGKMTQRKMHYQSKIL